PDEAQYTFLFRSLRKPHHGTALDAVPLRMRAQTNPGDRGGPWVKKRFICDDYFRASEEERFTRIWPKDGRMFVPARVEDNLSANVAEYEQSLAQLEPVAGAQQRHGDWTAHADGRFKANWWRRYRLDVDVLVLDDGSFVPLHEVPRVVV